VLNNLIGKEEAPKPLTLGASKFRDRMWRWTGGGDQSAPVMLINGRRKDRFRNQLSCGDPASIATRGIRRAAQSEDRNNA